MMVTGGVMVSTGGVMKPTGGVMMPNVGVMKPTVKDNPTFTGKFFLINGFLYHVDIKNA
jgi:hypothetical protein